MSMLQCTSFSFPPSPPHWRYSQLRSSISSCSYMKGAFRPLFYSLWYEWTLYFPIHDIPSPLVYYKDTPSSSFSYLFNTSSHSHECPLLKYVCSFTFYIFSWTSPKYYGFNYHLHADDFQMFISNSKLTFKFLLDMSTWISPKIKQIEKWTHPL